MKGYLFECLVRYFQRCRWFFKPSYDLVRIREIQIWCFSFIKVFSLQFDSFESVAVVNVERKKGPKYCCDHSGKTDKSNQDLGLLGRWPYLPRDGLNASWKDGPSEGSR